MPTYNTNLTGTYCSNWGLWPSLRELFQNLEDQYTLNPENEIFIDYDEKKQQLIISNKESILERSTILMGKSTKRDNKETIGQHGEGYKVALLVLTRLGKKVTIKNYKKNEIWTPVYVQDKSYDNEYVLKINVKKYIWKRVPDHNLTWVIEGITKEEWDQVKEKYLRFNKPEKSFEAQGSHILFEEKYKGCVYVNGLFVEKVKTNLNFGYNLKPSLIELDRDRRSIEGFDLYYNTSQLLRKYAESDEQAAKTVNTLIKNKSKDVEYLGSYFGSDSKLTKVIEDSFIEEHGEESYPVSSQEEFDYVKDVCPDAKPIIINETEKNILQNNNTKFKSVKTFAEQVFSKVLKKEKQTPKQILNTFLIKHSKWMTENTINDFKKIMDESVCWTDNSDFKLEDEAEEINLTEGDELYSEELSSEIEQESSDVSNIDFNYNDDEIPF